MSSLLSEYKTPCHVIDPVVFEDEIISSTQIRKRVAEGKDISGLVPPAVAEFIKQNGLYLAEDEK